MQSAYLVSYDIADDGRRNQVFRTLRAFGEHLQFSVFRCELSEVALIRLRGRLAEKINQNEDTVLLADLGPVGGRGKTAITTLGLPYAPPGRGPVIF